MKKLLKMTRGDIEILIGSIYLSIPPSESREIIPCPILPLLCPMDPALPDLILPITVPTCSKSRYLNSIVFQYCISISVFAAIFRSYNSPPTGQEYLPQ